MVARNPQFNKLKAGYLFPEIAKRKNALQEKQPEAHIISLSIGDTTEPLPPYITARLVEGVTKLGTKEGYEGYGPAHGQSTLREKIAGTFYQNQISPDEVFISDGAKCDLGRLQVLFGKNASIAVQDPAYPAYVDISVIMGQTGDFNGQKDGYDGLVYMSCSAENNFFPNLDDLPRTDIIIFCSPNNPTGAVATREQLEALVKFAKKNKSILIYDTAYAPFQQDPSLPKTIYEIEGAHEVAIEVGSFSKLAGFTGVRLGWTIVPKQLCFDDGTSVHQDWARLHTTYFNAASNIAQEGGVAILEDEGYKEVLGLVDYYMENAQILKKAFESHGFKVYGGENAPYLWVDFRPRKSWDAFEEILNSAHVVPSPGSGFGPAGEGFLRFSAFGSRADIHEAVSRLEAHFKMETVQKS